MNGGILHPDKQQEKPEDRLYIDGDEEQGVHVDVH
jgi:hypothetical protein